MKNILRQVLGFIIAFAILGTVPKVIYFIVLIIASPFASSEVVVRDIEATGNILGLLGSICLAFGAYYLITKTKRKKPTKKNIKFSRKAEIETVESLSNDKKSKNESTNTLGEDLKDSWKEMPAIIGIVIVIIVLIFIIVGISSSIYFWYQDKKVVDDKNSVEISVVYDLTNCNKDYPLRIAIENKTNKTLERVNWNIEITRKGYSSEISKDSYLYYYSDRIIAPGEIFFSCYKYELLEKYEAYYNNPENLNFEVVRKYSDFKE